LPGDVDNKQGQWWQQGEAVAARRCSNRGAFESDCGSDGRSGKGGGSGVMRSRGEEHRWPWWQRRVQPRRRLRRLQR
ncbi:hypothetical protein GW17_00034491, partial [Ensete ventricosum]